MNIIRTETRLIITDVLAESWVYIFKSIQRIKEEVTDAIEEEQEATNLIEDAELASFEENVEHKEEDEEEVEEVKEEKEE